MDPSSTSRLDDLGASMDDLAGPTRSIVLAVEKTADAVAACAFLRDNVLRGSSDILHIVHVAKIVPARESITHGPPGTSLSFREEPLPAVQSHVDDVRAWLAANVTPVAESTGATTRLHLFVEATTATAADVAAVIGRVADGTDAALVAVAKSNKTALNKLFVGSVAGEVGKLKRPVLMVVATE